MILRRIFLTAAIVIAAALPSARNWAADIDIKRLAPMDAHTFVYAKENEERAYQGEYLADAWKTFQDERICERVFDIVASRAPEEDMAKVKDVWSEIETALEPINLQALVEGDEFAMFNVMIGPFGHTVVAVRLTEKDAEDYRKGIGNLFEVIEVWAKDKVSIDEDEASGAKVTTLRIPKGMSYQPAVACLGDVFLIATSEELLKGALERLQDPAAKTKYDDERLQTALKHLPEPEDALTFFDAHELFKGMHGIGDWIRAQQPPDDDDKEKVERVITILNRVIKEVDFLEYEVVVEYTEEGQNRAAALGEFSDNVEETLLGRAITHGKPFEDWQSWVPADATAFSMNTGIYLHELYVGILAYVREEIPESKEHLAEWDALQEKVKVNLDEDILQSFSGENVSITLPNQQSVTALKCTNEARIRELLDRAIAGLKQIPGVEEQQIELADCEDEELEGFKEFKAAMLMMAPGVQPVIGFRDGWMIIGSSPVAAKTLLQCRAGDESTIADADSFKKFDLKTDGEVYSVSYSDIGAGIRAFADGIDQFAMMGPLMMMGATADASEEDRATINEVFKLLPSIAKVVRKFDFLEKNMSITREGPMENTYLRESVTLVRQPEKEDSEN